MSELITVTLYNNEYHMSHYDRHNKDGTMTIMNVTTEVTPDGVIVNRTEKEGVTIYYE